VNVDARVRARQAFFRAGKLEPGRDLLGRFVASQLGLGGASPHGFGELVDPGLELGQGALERVEALALDARAGSDREGPGGYLLLWSIGT
jgi:hypothetical protein